MCKKLLIICLMLLCWSSVALAADVNFTPPPAEHSLKYLSTIFGNMGFNEQWTPSNTHSPLLKMFDIFNHVILIFGIVVVLYTTIVASVNTAYHGKMMGDKWSSLWIPVRIVLGFALLIPQANGYALIQSLVMWLVIQSVGAADSLWAIMVDNMGVLHKERAANVKDEEKLIAEKIPTTYKPSEEVVYGVVTNLVRPLFRALVCQNYYARNFPATPPINGITYTASTATGAEAGTVTIAFKGLTAPNTFTANCGTIIIKRDKVLTDEVVGKKLIEVQKGAIQAIINKLMPLAKLTVAVPTSLDYPAALIEFDKIRGHGLHGGGCLY
jgi:conjugal transfer/type IV secretion protein DotA/TraY